MPGLLDKRLLFVTGKGGVGKSTISAALALAAARAGKRVLVCEVHAQERVAPLLGHPPVGAEVRQIEPQISAVNIDPAEAFREYALMRLKLRALYRAVFENRFMRQALRAIPSIAEIVTLGKIVYHAGDPRFDLVIVDTPATGHALTLLRTPQTVLDSVPPGALASEMEHMRATVADRALTGLVMVTLPEEMPINETIELDARLRRWVRVERSAVVLNGDLPLRFSSLDLEALEGAPGPLRPASRAALAYQKRSDLAHACVEKLRAEVPLPLARVPFLFTPAFDRAAIEAISHDLAVLT